jgi:hypothetical protein
LKRFIESGCVKKEHKYGYRSVHYIIKTKPANQLYFAEVQVRTIYEEAWSEIDHTIRYPYHQNNEIYLQYLMILNRLSGSADEMGAFILYLKYKLETIKIDIEKYESKLRENDEIIEGLRQDINNLQLKETDKEKLTTGLNKLIQMEEIPFLKFIHSPVLSDAVKEIEKRAVSNTEAITNVLKEQFATSMSLVSTVKSSDNIFSDMLTNKGGHILPKFLEPPSNDKQTENEQRPKVRIKRVAKSKSSDENETPPKD